MGEVAPRPTRAITVTMLAVSVVLCLVAVVLSGSGAPPARADNPRDLEITISYPSSERWEVVRIALLLEDDGRDPAVVEAEAQAQWLARFPGGFVVDPEVSGQYAISDWALEGDTATWHYNDEDKPYWLEGEYTAFQGGAAAWNYAADTDFHFEEGGMTTAGLSVCLGQGRDGQNTVGWRLLEAGTLAVTCTLMTPGLPQEFDIQFSFAPAWTLGTTVVNVDLQSVAIHEFGHALGLKHSTVSGSVMYSGYKRGTILREPAADDLAGLRELYGSGPGQPGPTAPAGQQLLPRGVVPALSRQ